MHTCKHTHTRTCTHADTHAHMQTHTHTHKYTHASTRTHLHEHRQTREHSNARTHTHTHTHTRAQANTQTRAGKHKDSSFLILIHKVCDAVSLVCLVYLFRTSVLLVWLVWSLCDFSCLLRTSSTISFFVSVMCLSARLSSPSRLSSTALVSSHAFETLECFLERNI